MRLDNKHDNNNILAYWNQENVESMYDKYLINAEIELIKNYIPENSKILDAGCGEGEGTIVYSSITGSKVYAVDFSDTRLAKAANRLKDAKNVEFKKVDFLGEYDLDKDYDIVISQRFMINLMEWELQKKVLLDLMGMLKPGGRLLMLEGSKQGVAALNDFRSYWGLEPIPVKWHNLFFDDKALIDFMQESGYKFAGHDGLGTYFLLTRGIRPYFDKNLDWDCEFNRLAATTTLRDILQLDNAKFSRLKLWIFEK